MKCSPGVSRRSFIHTALAGAAGAAIVPRLAGSKETSVASSANRFLEAAHELPLHADADVIICGAGPAGCAAAVAAARAGARTCLFEVHGCLGGVWTAGLLTYVFDFNHPGLTQELIRELDARDARRSANPQRFVYEPEAMKLLLEEVCSAAGVKIQLHTRVAAAACDGRRLSTIITESKSGREAWRAPIFIDATGDGDLGAQAGCGWDIGEGKEQNCGCQPMTLNALAVVRDAEALNKYISFFKGDGWDQHLPAVEAFKGELRRAGLKASYGSPTLFRVRDNLLLVMINHEYGVKPYNSAEMTAATLEGRAEVFRVVRGLNKLGGPWAGIQVAATAEQIGVRDGRRIHGRYTITREDLVNGSRHSDAVTRVFFGADIHATTKKNNEVEAIGHGGLKTQPYDIPLRALIAKDVDGLLMAGRCISGDFTAHASYRVTGDAVAMGEAAGKVAAFAVRTHRLPHEINWSEIVG